MARNLTSADLLEAVDPVGITTDAAWTMGVMVNFDSITPDGNAFLKIGNADGTLTRGYMAYVRGAASNTIHVRNSAGVTNPAATSLVTGVWYRITISHSGAGAGSIQVAIAGVEDLAPEALAQAAEIDTGDAFSVGRGMSSIGIANLDGSVARAFWLQGTALSPADANDIFDNLNTAELTYGSALAVLNRIDGGTDPEPDWRQPGTNDLAVVGAGTSQVTDPLGNPEEAPPIIDLPEAAEFTLAAGDGLGVVLESTFLDLPEAAVFSLEAGTLDLGVQELLELPEAAVFSLLGGTLDIEVEDPSLILDLPEAAVFSLEAGQLEVFNAAAVGFLSASAVRFRQSLTQRLGIYPANDGVIEVLGLKDAEGATIGNATVTAELIRPGEVTPIWEGPLGHGGGGDFSAMVEDLTLTTNEILTWRVEATSDEIDAEWTWDQRVTLRRPVGA